MRGPVGNGCPRCQREELEYRGIALGIMKGAVNLDYLKAMDQRVSRRTYTGEIVESKKAGYLKDRIEQLNQESGLRIYWIDDAQSAFSSFGKGYGMFKNVRSLIVMKGPQSDPHLREKAGYYGEILVLEATGMELGTCWISGTYDKGSNLFNVADDDELVCVITVGDVPEQQSFKEKLIYNVISRKRKPVEAFYQSDETVPDWFIDGIKAVQKAPSAVNSQKARFEYRNKTVSAGIHVTAHSDLIDLGIAKLHFELAAKGKFVFGNGSKFTKQS